MKSKDYMVRNYNPRPFEEFSSLPIYVVITEQYELIAKTKTGYTIRLAKLTIGKSVSAGNQLCHVLFESFSDHGERRAIAKTRMSNNERVFNAIMKAITEVGVEFESVTPCHSEIMLSALGAWIQARNPDIEQYEIVMKLKPRETYEEAKNTQL